MRVLDHTLDSLRKIIRDLQAENKRLRDLLEANNIVVADQNEFDENIIDDYDEDQGARIKELEPDTQMAREFFTLFWGRTDVYALRGSKGGYFPQCLNSKNNAVCPKRRGERVFCDEDCEGKKWRPIEPWMIVNHIKGKNKDCIDVMGTYPLHKDNTCKFLVFDFDNHEKDSYKDDFANHDDLWKSEVNALREACEISGIEALVERSRSGRGAHIWIFFEDFVDAGLARSFGYALLDKGARLVNMPSFKYYDRMYPSQSEAKSIGNLIALPLQGQALKNGNSAFIDRSWNAYEDQWKVLKNARKYSKTELESYIAKWNEEISGVGFVTRYRDADSSAKPWNRNNKFNRKDVIGNTLHIVLSNGIYVDGLNLLAGIKNAIKGLATIDNPIFYTNKRIGRSNYYNLRTVSAWKEEDGYIHIPRGLLSNIEEKCKEAGIEVGIKDERIIGRPIRVKFIGSLRDQQDIATRKLEKFDNGIMASATASGKTVMAAYLIAQKKVSTLVLINDSGLVDQWIEEMRSFLEVDEKPPVYYTKTGREKRRDSVYGTLISGQDKTTGIIDFALIGSAYHRGEYFPNIDSYGMVLYDECHHAGSRQAQEVLGRVKAKYVYGLSATPMRSDKLDDLLKFQLGDVRHRYTAREQADEQGLQRYIVPRFTRVVYLSSDNLTINMANDLIADSDDRNDQIIRDVRDVIDKGRTPVILTSLKRHAKYLYDRLSDSADHVYLIYGDNSKKQNTEYIEKLKSVPNDESVILIATRQKIGEGFNYPRLDTLMLAGPIRFEGNITQYVGRLNRIYKGKKDVFVYDYVDSHIRFFDNQYKSRLLAYKKLGYKVVSDISRKIPEINAIYNGHDYEEPFFKDVAFANESVLISSPYLIRKKVESLINIVKPHQESGLNVTVITLDPEEVGFNGTIEAYILISEMRNAGITVLITEDVGEHFAVFDDEIVWHGGMNLLGKADVWDNLIRVKSQSVAAELKEIMDARVMGGRK